MRHCEDSSATTACPRRLSPAPPHSDGDSTFQKPRFLASCCSGFGRTHALAHEAPRRLLHLTEFMRQFPCAVAVMCAHGCAPWFLVALARFASLAATSMR